MDERMFEELKEEIRKNRIVEKNAILGIVIQAMEKGGFGTYDTMVVVCETADILDNADYGESGYEMQDTKKVIFADFVKR